MRPTPLLLVLALLTRTALAEVEPPPFEVDPPPPARRAVEDPALRLRTHRNAGPEGAWRGLDRPAVVAARHAGRALDLLDVVPGGWLAVYREVDGQGRCRATTSASCGVSARLIDPAGEVRWSVDLEAHFSRPDELEVQDVRWDGSTLYFNEACQSYSRAAGGACSALVALDPERGLVRWRTAPLVSNHWILVLDDVLVVGYGFTGERDFLRVVGKRDGRVLATRRVKTAPSGLWRAGTPQGLGVRVRLDDGAEWLFRAPRAAAPKLVVWSRPKARRKLAPLGGP